MNGHWVKAPGHELFHRLKEIFGDLPFIAEDLGLITPEVDELREHFGMPGMRILQFGFADRGGHTYLPHRYFANTVVYTGTHDNNTTLGWWREGTTPRRARQRRDLSWPRRQKQRSRNRLVPDSCRCGLCRQYRDLSIAGCSRTLEQSAYEPPRSGNRQLVLALRS